MSKSRFSYKDYCEGKSITDQEVKENDPTFMKGVLRESEYDIRMLYFAGNGVLLDAGFIKFLIKECFSQLDAIKPYIDNYFNESTDELSKVEIRMILEEKKRQKYKLDKDYKDYRDNNQEFVKSFLENNKSDGFFAFSEALKQYANYEGILNYLADDFVKSIFYKNLGCRLEVFLHSQNMDKSTFSMENSLDFVVSIIASYDEALAEYVKSHEKVVHSLRRSMNAYYESWDSYERDQEIYGNQKRINKALK